MNPERKNFIKDFYKKKPAGEDEEAPQEEQKDEPSKEDDK